MAECAGLATCPFFNDRMKNMPATSGHLKKTLCQDTFQRCARFMVKQSLGGANVPSDLFPNQVERAKTLIAGSAPA